MQGLGDRSSYHAVPYRHLVVAESTVAMVIRSTLRTTYQCTDWQPDLGVVTRGDSLNEWPLRTLFARLPKVRT